MEGHGENILLLKTMCGLWPKVFWSLLFALLTNLFSGFTREKHRCRQQGEVRGFLQSISACLVPCVIVMTQRIEASVSDPFRYLFRLVDSQIANSSAGVVTAVAISSSDIAHRKKPLVRRPHTPSPTSLLTEHVRLEVCTTCRSSYLNAACF